MSINFWVIFGWYMVLGLIWFVIAKWIKPEIMEDIYDDYPLNKNIIDCIAMLGSSILWLPILFIVLPNFIKNRRNK